MYKLLITDIQPLNSKRITRNNGRVTHRLDVHAPINCWQYIDQEDEEYLLNEVGAAAMYCRSVAFNTNSCEFKWRLRSANDHALDEDYKFEKLEDLDIQSVFPIDFLHGSLVERMESGEEDSVTYTADIEHDSDLAVIISQEDMSKFKGDVDMLAQAIIAQHINAITRLSFF